jgi:DNA-binding NtrC family response regulator
MAVTQRLQILVLDDEPIVGRRVKPSLEKLGVDVEVFESPVEALARLQEKHFDVVVTDLRMGKIDGMQVLARCEGESTKVIIITGFSTMDIAREALSKGAFEILSKPFKTRELRTAIQRAASALGRPLLWGLDEG